MFRKSFNRPNLIYEVREKPGTGAKIEEEIAQLIKNDHPRDCGIVYAFSKKEADELATGLRSRGIRALAYHAGMGDKDRRDVQQSWSDDKTKVVVATVAFGMGIDKPDVRFVIHATMPKVCQTFKLLH